MTRSAMQRLRDSRAFRAALAAILAVGLLLVGAPPKTASAAECYLENTGTYAEYGGYRTGKTYVDGVPAYCGQPTKATPQSGSYEKVPLYTLPGTTTQHDVRSLAATLWFGYDGPGFDRSMFPSAWYDGSAITDDQYYAMTHIVVADFFTCDGGAALSGCDDDFTDWAVGNILSWDDDLQTYYENSLQARIDANSWKVPQWFVDSCFCIETGPGTQVMCGFKKGGYLQIHKSSANAAITDGNGCYELSGAQYGVYASESDAHNDANRLCTLTTGGDGVTGWSGLLGFGTYWYKEIVSPKGYELDSTPHAVSVSTGNLDGNSVAHAWTTDEPANDPAEVILQKVDKETGDPYPMADGSLEGALFQVDYYDTDDPVLPEGAEYDSEDVRTGADPTEPERSWVFKTDGDGFISMDADRYLVSGEFYTDKWGNPTFPLGTYVIHETKAPEGYNMEGMRFVRTVHQKGDFTAVGTFNTLTDDSAVKEQVKRGDIEFQKKVENDMAALKGIPFRIASKTTGESHVVFTDENGYFSTSAAYNLHTYDPNGNDDAYDDAAKAVVEANYDPAAGTWFGTDSQGKVTQPNDSLSALPYDTYTISELPCAANEGLQLVTDFEVTVSRDMFTIDLGTLDDPNAYIATSARDSVDGDKVVVADPGAKVIDTVSYTGLVTGREYTLSAELVDPATGEEVATGSKTFTAAKANGKVEVELGVDASAMAGRSLVVYEELSCDGRTVADHKDSTDSEQTVVVVPSEIGTTATDGFDGDKTVVAGSKVTVKDDVEYKNLIPGKEYELSGKLMVKSTGEPLTVNGSEVTASKKFTPAEANGTVEISFEFDASALGGSELVAFETLTKDGLEVAVHADIDDEGQTVKIADPKIGTTATDKLDGDKSVVADAEASIDDEVAYENLLAGMPYEATGILIDKSTGLPLLQGEGAEQVTEDQLKAFIAEAEKAMGIERSGESADGSVSYKVVGDVDTAALEKLVAENQQLVGLMKVSKAQFTPEKASGSLTMAFPLDAEKLGGKDVVVYEIVAQGGRVSVMHTDVNDEGQTVKIVNGTIGTTATDKTDGDHYIMPSKDTVIVDTVAYCNLIPGKEYTLTAKLMDKQNNKQLYIGDKPVGGTVTFTPNAPTGTVDVEIAFDSTSLEDGQELVAFETLTKDGKEVAVHADIEDKAQTVTVGEPPEPAAPEEGNPYDKNGATYAAIVAAIAALVAAAGAACAYAVRQRKLAGAAAQPANGPVEELVRWRDTH